VLQVPLQPAGADGRWAALRPLCGHDEVSIGGCGDLDCARLLDRLLVAAPGGSVGPGDTWTLSLSDRDRLLVALYRHHYGDRIEGSVDCSECGATFEVAFVLADLAHGLESGGITPRATGPDAEGAYVLPDGRRFRLPTVEDRMAVFGMEPTKGADTLVSRCLLAGDPNADREALEAAMSEAGPVLDVDLEASCAECGTVRDVRFDIRAHLLGALAAEKAWLAREVHSIATAYGWGLEEILGLPRDERRRHVRLIEAERVARRGSRA
jgi:hypothetical protein